MTSLQQIKKWSEQYPFDEGELEIILRCHNSIVNPKDREDAGSFLNLLAHSFPYVFFFLPIDEIQNRIGLVENYILPPCFGEKLKKSIFHLQGNNETESEASSIELLIKGISNCCKGDSNETLGVIFDCSCNAHDGTAAPEDIIKLCYQLSIAASVLVSPKIDEKRILELAKQPMALHGLTQSLRDMVKTKGGRVEKQMFIDWGKKCVPHIGSTMAGFIHNLVFHGKSSHSRVPPFTNPELQDASSIFSESNAGNLFAISCMSPDLGGKVSLKSQKILVCIVEVNNLNIFIYSCLLFNDQWRRLFSSIVKDTNIGTLEQAIGHHVGPSIFVIKIESGHLIGA